jgi:small subunit ribosomal protein S3
LVATKVILQRSYSYAEIDEFLEKRLTEAGYAGMEMEKLPLGYRLNISVVKPGLVIGRKGMGIRELTDTLAARFKLENLSINVVEVTSPDLNPRIVAARIASMAQRGMAFRRATLVALASVMRAGAMGCEITVRGKLRSERAHFERHIQGIVPKSGHMTKTIVSKAVTDVLLKMGLYGIQVSIAYKDAIPPEFEAVKAQAQEASPTPAEAQKTEVQGNANA